MPPARKRRGGGGGPNMELVRNVNEESSSSGLLINIKRQKLAPRSESALCNELCQILRSETTDNDELLCEPFLRVPRKKLEPEYHSVVTNPIDFNTIQQKVKNDEYEGIDQMVSDVEQLVNNAKTYYPKESSQYQQADMLWELCCGAKERLIAELAGDESTMTDDYEDDDASRLSSVTDDSVRQSAEQSLGGVGTGEAPKVPVLKLKVAAGGYTEGAAVIGPDGENSLALPSTECSSDVDAASETQSTCLSTARGRLSSCSELEDQTSCEATMGLRERRYAYRDFITPKQTRKKPVQDAEVKEKAAQQAREAAATGDEEQENVYEALFAAVVNAADGSRVLSDPFKVLPLKSKYVDYYQVIREPIDLRMIAQKIQSNGYTNLDEMYKDLMLMVSNAKQFNKPTSLIYKDAVSLRKIFTARKHELEQKCSVGGSVATVRSQRVRTRGGAAGSVPSSQNLVASIATLRGESDEDEEESVKNEGVEEAESEVAAVASRTGTADSDGEGSQSGEENDLWTLFCAVKEYKSNLGIRLAEPFLRLPSKRIYPDYYKEIKKPLSLMKIQKKLKKDCYDDVEELSADLNVVFENAKQYNIEDSKIFQDAVKLQAIMNAKKQELLRTNKDSGWEAGSSRSRQTTPEAVDDSGQKRKRQRSLSSDDALKKRLHIIFKYINDYRFDGRRLIDVFVTLPSRKDYPDYYKVISEPIDMTMIENKLKAEKYASQQSLVSDLELLFKNARHYNEENSAIYKDAETLERMLHSRVRMLPPIDDSPSLSSAGRTKTKSANSLTTKLQELYNTIRDYSDSHGRILSTPYMKLPARNEYPDYYEVIKKPIDMQKVLQRVTAGQYHAVDEMVADFVLMFNNACKYNEPESLIYKDALTLQRLCLSKKAELVADDGNEVPDVQSLVQEMMRNLFNATYSHTDEEGRCFSDSFLELPARLVADETAAAVAEIDDSSKKAPRNAPNFDQIKYNIDKGRYKRFDRFQDDMFEVFEYARKASTVDSQVYEDAVELQLYFIQQRDDLCRRGEVLLTPALSYTYQQLVRELEGIRREHAAGEQKDEDDRKKLSTGGTIGTVCKVTVSDDSFECNGQVYRIGDFVYVEQRDRDKGAVPHIVCIERIQKGEDGDYQLYGCWFLRPNETFHVATRKFLQKEVFKSDFYDNSPFHKVLGRCYVMFVKDYFRIKPEGFSDDDVYVCESRYSAKCKNFKKIKQWQVPKNTTVLLMPRDQVLTPVRVASVFADKSDTSDAGSMCGGGAGTRHVVDDLQTTEILDKHREVVVQENAVAAEDQSTYYEQYQSPTGLWVKLGDAVYLKSSSDDQQASMMRVDKLWTTMSGEAYISGPYYITPVQVDHTPSRMFYKKEVLRSTREDTVPLLMVVGRCAVLTYKEYCTSRFTEVPENDVYLCEAKYINADKIIKKFNKPLRRVTLSVAVCDDEIYFFKKPIIPHKELSPLLPKALDMGLADEESMDCPSSVEQSFNDTSSYQGETTMDQTPSSSRRRKPKASNKVRQISGYIVYAAEIRREIQMEYPSCGFGEISRIVGLRWKELPKETKDRFEERARSIAVDHASKKALTEKVDMSLYPASPGGTAAESRSMSPHANSLAPSTSGNNGSFYMPPPYPHNGTPYHHQYPPPGMPGHMMMGPNGQFPQMQCNMQQMPPYPNSMQAVQQKPPPPPMFVSVPARTQRLVHSEAYLRYIEGLTSGSRSVGGWEKSLYAKPPDNPAAAYNGSAADKLPTHWLANGPGHHDNAVSALWALRDLMMKDAVVISRTLDFAQL